MPCISVFPVTLTCNPCIPSSVTPVTPVLTGNNPCNTPEKAEPPESCPEKAVKMNFSLFFCFFCFFSTVIDAEECLINCYCEEYRVECTLFSCADEINTEYDEVVIHGTLCQSHRYTLTHIIQDTLIILKDDICEDIPNCQ